MEEEQEEEEEEEVFGPEVVWISFPFFFFFFFLSYFQKILPRTATDSLVWLAFQEHVLGHTLQHAILWVCGCERNIVTIF